MWQFGASLRVEDSYEVEIDSAVDDLPKVLGYHTGKLRGQPQRVERK